MDPFNPTIGARPQDEWQGYRTRLNAPRRPAKPFWVRVLERYCGISWFAEHRSRKLGAGPWCGGRPPGLSFVSNHQNPVAKATPLVPSPACGRGRRERAIVLRQSLALSADGK